VNHPAAWAARRARWPALAAWLAVLVLAVSGLAADVTTPPSPTRWVTDTASLLAPSMRDGLDAQLEQYQRQTGHQIVVWIGQSIGAEPLDDFAVRTFKAWQLGRKGQDDGLLLIVLAKDRRMAIEVGYGLEGRVPDALARRVIDEVMAPRLRAGDADGALQAGVDAILSAVEGHPVSPGEPATAPPPDRTERPSMLELVVFGLLGLAFLVLLVTHPSLAMYFLFSMFNGGGGFGGGRSDRGGFSGGGGRSGGGGARGSW
jgi:uncharacterized protein